MPQSHHNLNSSDLNRASLDLRNNDGGNMWPMLAGLSPILGNGVVGYFVSPNTTKAWQIKNGASLIDGAPMASLTVPPTKVNAESIHVAVLTSPRTASSGEAVAIAFRAREDQSKDQSKDQTKTKNFGQPTAGLSTANSLISLSDGAQMAVTTSTFADRTSKLYGGKIQPDEFIAATSQAATLADDEVVTAAVTWLALSAKNNCGKSIGENAASR